MNFQKSSLYFENCSVSFSMRCVSREFSLKKILFQISLLQRKCLNSTQKVFLSANYYFLHAVKSHC